MGPTGFRIWRACRVLRVWSLGVFRPGGYRDLGFRVADVGPRPDADTGLDSLEDV